MTSDGMKRWNMESFFREMDEEFHVGFKLDLSFLHSQKLRSRK